ncbi:aminotransferase [Actinomyces radicidentis]|uniref:Aminotransferase n=1 Tax=Actinomyces radicidentis TaxID=111015 RepID=A0A0X8JEA7_ACTRD|nr:daptide-type RiPP biosynthesis aminotransferase [Actinomyces radicidentis]AMD86972.1 aminotransferase [Actinomyces radicidentis]
MATADRTAPTARAPRAARPTTQFFVPPSAFSTTPYPVAAHGTRIRYADGSEALDGISGLWNVPLGYGHTGVADAVHTALLEASYLTSFRGSHAWADRASRAVLEVAGTDRYDRVLHTTSGSAALDSVIKLCRQYQLLRGEPSRQVLVTLKGSYHGTTMGAMALTGDDLCQSAYGVDLRTVRHVDHRRPRDLARLLERESERVAAVVIEPVQGSGTHVVGRDFLEQVLAGRREHGYLVVADEVATGFGRTGPMFASERWPEAPDVLASSKGLTNGTQAASVVLLSPKVTRVLDEADSPVMHGETQAGSPASCAAILATIEAFRSEDVLRRGERVAAQLDARLRELADAVPGARTTGAGCFRSLTVPGLDAAGVTELITRCRAAGAVVQPGPSSFQVVPALVYEEADLDLLMDRVHQAVTEVLGLRAVSAA